MGDDGVAEAAAATVPPVPEDFVPDLGPPRPITLRLVMENSLTPEALARFGASDVEDAQTQARELKTIHLEWQGICEIANLEAFEGAETLYLQRNRIQRIEGLESMVKLQFLALQHNQISSVENLLHLLELELLDLSGNQIDVLNYDQLPESINILNLKDNPCITGEHYKQRLLDRLPDLLYLDGQELAERMGEQANQLEVMKTSLYRDVNETHVVKGVQSLSPDGQPLGEMSLAGGEKGLSAYWRRDELRTGISSTISDQIDAYSVEMLADVDGLGSRCEDIVKRSRARQQKIEAGPLNASASLSASLTAHQLDDVRRLSASLRQRQAEEASADASGANHNR